MLVRKLYYRAVFPGIIDFIVDCPGERECYIDNYPGVELLHSKTDRGHSTMGDKALYKYHMRFTVGI